MWRKVLNGIDLDGFFERIGRTKVLVIGDVMLDEFIWGKVERISPEAPVPVVAVTHETRLLGGAANVVNNIRSLGGEVALCGVVGPDPMGERIREMLKGIGADGRGVMVDRGRPTTVKTRIIAHSQQVVRFDRESTEPISPSVQKEIMGFLEEEWGWAQGVIVSDYGKGVVTRELMDYLLGKVAEDRKPLIVDPKMDNFRLYRGVTAITPNTAEAEAASRRKIQDEATLRTVGRLLLRRFRAEAVLITRGEEGMALFQRGGRMDLIPTVAKEVYDVTGAGDTVAAVFTLGVASGLSYLEAAVVANCAAGIVVGKVGTASVSPGELREALLEGRDEGPR